MNALFIRYNYLTLCMELIRRRLVVILVLLGSLENFNTKLLDFFFGGGG